MFYKATYTKFLKLNNLDTSILLLNILILTSLLYIHGEILFDKNIISFANADLTTTPNSSNNNENYDINVLDIPAKKKLLEI